MYARAHFMRGVFALKNPKPSRIVRPMKRTLILLALMIGSALPALAQEYTDLGIIIGGSRRFVDGAPHQDENDFLEQFLVRQHLHRDLLVDADRTRAQLPPQGRTDRLEVSIPYEVSTPTEENPDAVTINRRDVEGEVHHVEGLVEYEFDEIFGSSSLFAGLGYYRLSAPGEEAQQTGA